MTFKTSFVAAALTALIGFSASAKSLNGNVIVRLNKDTGATEQMITKEKITSQAQAEQLAKGGHFTPVNVATKELDREQGASSFYFDCPQCYGGGYNNYAITPQYYYYGVNFQPYYQLSYQNCNYYYYGQTYYRYNNWWY